MMFAQRLNRLMTRFRERIPVVKATHDYCVRQACPGPASVSLYVCVCVRVRARARVGV
jgi:hypothetical protein